MHRGLFQLDSAPVIFLVTVPQIVVKNFYLMAQWVKNLPASAGDAGGVVSIPGLGRSPGGEHGNPLQYSCLENSMDRGPWCAIVHGVAKSQT